ncbi:hypothetical protein QBC47DRAFT_351441 [Echria macrotheca]|uniref:Uncharacterized protein n=1 Tax=Echria macrotheca TaxID=438768 RepID=A0AAJ0B5U7_9PEZI|nr:hypothetical protein QBC47DRAFT_351441 [Echria macrotheca]
MDTGAGLFQGAPSSRLRVLKHLSEQKASLLKSQAARIAGLAGPTAEEDVDEDPNKPKELPPNSMQLYSYYEPSMQGGVYEIEVKQTVAHPTDTHQAPLNLASTQKFNVNAPRFTLPPGIVHSTYPPQGLGDHNNVLPHIVFNDPHLPWEQQGSPKQEDIDGEEENKPDGKKAKNKIPWVALLSFVEDELKLESRDLKKRSDKGLFPNPVTDREQNKATFVTQLTMGEYLEMGGDDGTATPPAATVVTPIKDDQDGEKIDRDTQVDVIFPKAKYVRDLFAGYDDQGTRKPEVEKDASGVVTKTNSPDLSRFAYLSHVRNVNTRHIANAGLDDDGLFSVVHGHRSGPLNLTSPKPIIVHLVSLEGVEDNLKFPLDDNKRIAFVSLYSWTYLCLPPDEVNFVDSMRHIGFSIKDNKCWLRTTDDVIAHVKASTKVKGTPAKLTDRLTQRMNDGYCLQRYRLHTGEETMAFYRGPLTPCYVPPVKEAWWPFQSNFSTDYQVLDPNLGIMDITYSAAWQLGRTLGIANQAYTAALVRLRTGIQTTGRRDALKEVAAEKAKSKSGTLHSIAGSIGTMAEISAADAGEEGHPPEARHRNLQPPQPLIFQTTEGDTVPHDHVMRAFVRKNVAAATSAAGAAHPGPQGLDELFIPFNDITLPKSADWQLVQTWILDNLFLKNIPAHYILPDPSYLPPESIRFFYIDNNWMDAFVDGALSIGNHLDRKDDVARQSMKRNLNRYFESKYVDEDGHELNYHPQIPCFGFLMRSAVVKAFPDIQIHAPWAVSDDVAGKREPTLRFETLDKDILLCLFDRMPGSPHWDPTDQITLSQPPHQQCFSIGTNLAAGSLEVEFPAVYTTTDNPPEGERYDALRIVKWFNSPGKAPMEAATKGDTDSELPAELKSALPKAVFDWDSRMLVFPAFSAAAYEAETKPQPTMKYFDESVPTSALVGTVLTSHISKMKIELPPTTRTFPAGTAEEDKLPPDSVLVPRHIRLPKDDSDNPDDWVVVDRPDTSSSPPPDPDPNKPAPPPHQSPPSLPPGKPTGLPKGFNPSASPPISDGETTHLRANENALLNKGITSQFELVIFPLGTPTPSSARPPVKFTIPKPDTVADHAIDIVVGVRLSKKPITLQNLQLFSVEVRFPMGGKATDLIASPYQGSGGRMLSNPRFNAHCNVEKDGKGQETLVFTLIPRTTARLVPLRNVGEISFVVNQARLNGNGGRVVPGPAVVMRENYRRQNRDPDNGVVTRFSHDASNPVVVEKVFA